MMFGSYDVPEIRLVPNSIADVKKVYDIVKTEHIGTKEIGNVFGYKQHSTGIFYRRLTSMTSYGLLTQMSRSSYKVSDLGIALCYPEPEKEAMFKNQAILNVKLWNEIFKKFGKNPPTENFWIQLKNITGIEPVEAQKIQSQIRKWYIDDISLLTLDPLGHPLADESTQGQVDTQSKPLISISTNNSQMSQQLVQPKSAPNNSVTHELIQFGEVSLSLPKKDLRKQWGKLQKYMEIYLEDYQEEQEISNSITSQEATDFFNQENS